MTYVITQPCCNDATCASVCPVNCIHPTPNDPDFGTADMLYIDPRSCIDCGVCLPACPVDAIVPGDKLDSESEKYLAINAEYYTDHAVDGPPILAPRPAMPEEQPVRHAVAIVGAGPSALFAASRLLGSGSVRVDIFDRLLTPFGLARSGVAPDHTATKAITRHLDAILDSDRLRLRMGVELGSDITHDELAANYDAVVYAIGASADRSLDLPGEELDGSLSATSFVGWYNGHPDHADLEPDLNVTDVALVGNGNVSLDVARVLLGDTERLARTDIADHALQALASSSVTTVTVIARRGIAHAAFSIGEFVSLGSIPGVDVVIDPAELILDDLSSADIEAGTLSSRVATLLETAREYAHREPTPGNKRLVIRFLSSPVELVGDHSVESVVVHRTVYRTGTDAVDITDEREIIPAGLVIRAIGYRARPIAGVPFDESRAIVPNIDGRVTADDGTPSPGLYVVGWIKHGAKGGIGVNRRSAEATADLILADLESGSLPAPTGSPDVVDARLHARRTQLIETSGWRAIDIAEVAAGQVAGRPRRKLVTNTDLYRAAVGHDEASAAQE